MEFFLVGIFVFKFVGCEFVRIFIKCKLIVNWFWCLFLNWFDCNCDLFILSYFWVVEFFGFYESNDFFLSCIIIINVNF